MRTVVIVGAGGSLAQASALRPSRRRLHPPLDLTFFEKANELSKSVTSVANRVRRLRRVIEASGLFFDPWAPPSPPMEQFFADVYYEVASNDPDAFPVFVELLHLYAVVLAHTTNWMACRNRPGLIGKLLRVELERSLPDELTVITFNQDLVIENELATLPIRYGELALQSLYGTVALDAVPGLRNARFAHLVSETGSALPVRLLKLHGSLNWMVKTVERSPRPGTLFPPPSRSRQVYVINDREVSDNIALRTGAIQGRSRWYLWPVVVPPIYDKQRIVAMDLFREVWNRARDALENAERLLLVGYSLPEADILARQMLRRTFTRNEGLDAIECINPDVALVVKLKTVLGPNVVRIFHDIPSYLAQTA